MCRLTDRLDLTLTVLTGPVNSNSNYLNNIFLSLAPQLKAGDIMISFYPLNVHRFR